MSVKPYMILVASQKGGVGKTTVALNLAVALASHKYTVLLVDSDVESASISEHLGIRADGKGYLDAVNGKVDLKDTMFAYGPLELYIIPGTPSKGEPAPDPEDLQKFYSALKHVDFDFVLVDGQPGIFSSNITKYFDDVAIITTPDSVSAMDSARTAEYCEKYRLEHRLIINKIGYSPYDLSRDEIEKLYGDVAFQIVPDEKIVAESVLKRKPAYLIDRGSYFSLAMDELARAYALKIEETGSGVGPVGDRESKPGFFEKLGRWFFESK